MNIQPAHRTKALAFDGGNTFFTGSVIQRLRRFCFRKIGIDRNRMALIGPDAGLVRVEGVALLFIGADDLLQQFHRKRMRPVYTFDQCLRICPAMVIEGDSDDFRLMPQDQGNIFACRFQITHRSSPFFRCGRIFSSRIRSAGRKSTASSSFSESQRESSASFRKRSPLRMRARKQSIER